MSKEKISLEEAFKKLISKRKWYDGFPSPGMAKKDKYNFVRGVEIPEKRIREYLTLAGGRCVQKEKWIIE